MSILLEALRKSEAQRKLGKTPTLESPLVGGHVASDNGRMWIPAVMVLLTVGVIGWTGLKQFQRPEGLTSQAVSAPVPGPQESVPDQPVAPRTGPSRQPAKTPVMDFSASNPAPESEAVKAGTPAADSGKDVRLPAKKSRPPASNRRSAVPVSTTEESLAAAPVDSPPAGAAGNDADRVNARRTDRVEPSVPDSISYWQIPQSVRGDLPELHMTVLVYAENPEDRFLLINGQRLHEKEGLENGMVLDEIRRDRAIFSYRNYRFYLKN